MLIGTHALALVGGSGRKSARSQNRRPNLDQPASQSNQAGRPAPISAILTDDRPMDAHPRGRTYGFSRRRAAACTSNCMTRLEKSAHSGQARSCRSSRKASTSQTRMVPSRLTVDDADELCHSAPCRSDLLHICVCVVPFRKTRLCCPPSVATRLTIRANRRCAGSSGPAEADRAQAHRQHREARDRRRVSVRGGGDDTAPPRRPGRKRTEVLRRLPIRGLPGPVSPPRPRQISTAAT